MSLWSTIICCGEQEDGPEPAPTTATKSSLKMEEGEARAGPEGDVYRIASASISSRGQRINGHKMASIVASSTASGADQEFQRIQEVVDLTEPDAPVNLDADGILALQIALDLSATEMDEMKGFLTPRLDPHGTGTLTREAWRAVSAEWHTSGKSFLDFVTTTRGGAPPLPTIATTTDAHAQQPVKTASTATATKTASVTGTRGAAEATAAAEVDDVCLACPPVSSLSFLLSCLASVAGSSVLLACRPLRV